MNEHDNKITINNSTTKEELKKIFQIGNVFKIIPRFSKYKYSCNQVEFEEKILVWDSPINLKLDCYTQRSEKNSFNMEYISTKDCFFVSNIRIIDLSENREDVKMLRDFAGSYLIELKILHKKSIKYLTFGKNSDLTVEKIT